MRNGSIFVGRDQDLRRRILVTLLQSWISLSAPALLLVLAAEWARRPGRVWEHVPFLLLALAHGAGPVFGPPLIRRLEQPAPPHRLSILAVAGGCALSGLLWGSAMLVTARFLSPEPQQFLLPSLLYASILLAPSLCGGIAFAAAVAAAATVPVGAPRALVAAYGGTALLLILWRHVDFVRCARARAELEQQGEIIGILLHDFEEQGSSWLWETDAEFRLVSPSAPLLAAVGCSAQTLQALSLRRWIAAKERRAGGAATGLGVLARAIEERAPFRNVRLALRRHGEVRWLLVTGKPVQNRDGGFRGYRGIGTDVTATERSERQLVWLARHDSLTRLPNRAHFHEAVAQSSEDTMVEGTPVALLCLDLDGFKEINDTMGHPAGDALLVQVAARLQGCLRAGDVAGRLGGDEFALLMHDADHGSAGALASRVLARIADPFEIEGTTVRIGVSIGIMLSAEGGTEARALFKGADTALYEAKQAGRGTARVFRPTSRVPLAPIHSLGGAVPELPPAYAILTA